jgi:dCTP deaminase
MLTAHEIAMRVSQKDGPRIVIEPYDRAQLNPNSYDLTLAPNLMTYEESELDVRVKPTPDVTQISADGFVLQPGELYLGVSIEYTETHGMVPMINGKSSLARLGVSVHQTGGFGDIGFCGNWTLEITVVKPTRIFAGMRFAQLCWFYPDGLIGKLYNGKYQNSRGQTPVQSMSSKDWAGGDD